jgi:hypothetical protein
MNLRWVHAVLILLSAALAVLFGIWCLAQYGRESGTTMIGGTKLGVLVLLAVTLVVQGAFVGFFVYLRRRAKRIADVDLEAEWSELQGAPRTS